MPLFTLRILKLRLYNSIRNILGGFMKRLFVFMISASLLLSFLSASASEAENHFYIKRGVSHAPATTDPAFESACGEKAFYRDVRAGETGEKRIYLTFDAGYENGNVAKILDILKEENVPGAFFVLAHLVEANTDLVKRMRNEGHLVCNHTAHHKNMAKLSLNDFCSEIRSLEEIYTEKTGEQLARFYRPPEGTFSFSNLEHANEMGYRTVFWSLAYCDWNDRVAPSKEKAMQILRDNTHPGAIVLLHPMSQINVDILREMIQYWRAEGYRLCSLEEVGGQ